MKFIIEVDDEDIKDAKEVQEGLFILMNALCSGPVIVGRE